ncbi:hypothetical protein [Halorubrum sp. DTA98]|uniref:transcriptional regulator FilR1 domain-containing protein n=1 Tax=Halorubrum sp. DTA98 TaxID=3402163 RepID=UPI003AAEB1B3
MVTDERSDPASASNRGPVSDPESATATLVALVEDAVGEPIETTPPAEPSDRDDTVAVVGRGDAPSPIDRLVDRVADADSIVGVVPRLDASLVERLRRRDTSTDSAGNEGVEARIVVTGAAREAVTGPAGPMVRAALESGGGIELFACEGDSPVGLLLVDDRAIVGLFDDAGLAAVLIADAPAVRVREWVAAACRRSLATAERLSG